MITKLYFFWFFIFISNVLIAQLEKPVVLPDSLKLKLKLSKNNADSVNSYILISDYFRYYSTEKRLMYALKADSINRTSNLGLKIKVQIALVKGYYNFANYEKTDYYLSEIEKNINRIKNTEEQNLLFFNFLVIKGDIFSIQKKYKRADECYIKAQEYLLHIAKKIPNLAEYYLYYAFNLDAMGNTKEALENYMKTEELLSDSDTSIYTARIYSKLALIYLNFQITNKSIKCYQKALNIYSKLNDIEEIAEIYNSLGILHFNQRKNKQAIKFYNEYLKYSKINKNNYAIALAYNNLGYEYSLIGQHDSSETYLKKSIELSISIDDTVSLLNTYHSLGAMYLNSGKLNNAVLYLNEARKRNVGIDQELEGYIALDMSKVNFEFKKNDLALKELKLAENIALKNNFQALNLDILRMFSKIYAEIGNFEKALIFEKKAQYYDSIYFNESIEKEINLLNIKFTVEKLEAKISQLKKITKQQESQVEKEYFKNRNLSYIIFVIVIIVILLRFTQKFIKKYRNIYNVQNTKLKINNFKLEKIKSNLIEINLSKDRFFNLIAFNLKQPFKILLDYTEKIIKNYDSLTPEEVIKYNELINFTAQDLFELLENLLYWSRLEVGTLTIHIQKHRINEFIEENLSWFKNRISSKGVLLQSFLSEDVLLDFDKNLISLVIRNLISNALSQINQNGIIKISTLKYNNQIEISIENNGQNLSKKPDEILSIKHISENPGKNLGFIISKKIIELHKSKLNILTKDRLGSRYSFKLSLN